MSGKNERVFSMQEPDKIQSWVYSCEMKSCQNMLENSWEISENFQIN